MRGEIRSEVASTRNVNPLCVTCMANSQKRKQVNLVYRLILKLDEAVLTIADITPVNILAKELSALYHATYIGSYTERRIQKVKVVRTLAAQMGLSKL